MTKNNDTEYTSTNQDISAGISYFPIQMLRLGFAYDLNVAQEKKDKSPEDPMNPDYTGPDYTADADGSGYTLSLAMRF